MPAAAGRSGRAVPGCSSVDAIPGAAAAAAITIAAPAADIVARRTFRRCARCLTRSKVPGGGASGSTSAFSQPSILSCWVSSSLGSPSAAFSLARAWCRSALTVPSGRPSIAATSRTANPA